MDSDQKDLFLRGSNTMNEEQKALSRRVHQALNRAGMTQTELHQKADVKRDVINKAITRGSVSRDEEARDRVAATLGVSTTWLWFGNGPMERQIEVAPGAAPPAPSLGFMPDPRGYVRIVADEGWEPIAKAGHALLVTPSYPPKPGDRVYVQSESKGEGLFRYLSDEGDVYRVQSPGSVILRFEKNEPGLIFHRLTGITYGWSEDAG